MVKSMLPATTTVPQATSYSSAQESSHSTSFRLWTVVLYGQRGGTGTAGAFWGERAATAYGQMVMAGGIGYDMASLSLSLSNPHPVKEL